MSNLKHDNDASLADYEAGWDKMFANERVTVAFAVVGLTNFGERPVQSTRLADVLERSVSEAETLARQWGWPGTRVEDGFISVDPERATSATRRRLQIGDRRFGASGCAPDIFGYAPLVRPSIQVEETCPATGTPIRLVFTPNRVESVDPGGAVVPMPAAQMFSEFEASCDIEEVDANICVQAPLFSSAEAAQGWLAAHPGGRLFSIKEAWDLSFLRDWRDRMSALLSLAA